MRRHPTLHSKLFIHVTYLFIHATKEIVNGWTTFALFETNTVPKKIEKKNQFFFTNMSAYLKHMYFRSYSRKSVGRFCPAGFSVRKPLGESENNF